MDGWMDCTQSFGKSRKSGVGAGAHLNTFTYCGLLRSKNEVMAEHIPNSHVFMFSVFDTQCTMSIFSLFCCCPAVTRSAGTRPVVPALKLFTALLYSGCTVRGSCIRFSRFWWFSWETQYRQKTPKRIDLRILNVRVGYFCLEMSSCRVLCHLFLCVLQWVSNLSWRTHNMKCLDCFLVILSVFRGS